MNRHPGPPAVDAKLEEAQARRVTHATLATRALVIAAVVLAVAVAGMQLWVTVQTNGLAHSISDQQDASTQRGRDIKALAEAIRSCTSPRGDCYRRGQQRTGAAVGSINEVVILAAACADRPDVATARQIATCVRRHLGDMPQPDQETP